jgi:type IV secretory pathway VirB10-like protein
VVDGVTLREGTVIEAVLTNRLDGSNEGPVNAMVTTDVYAGTWLVIPKGARVLGTASKVTEQYSERLAIAFHRLLLQDGRSVDLDTVPGLDQQGAVGVKDQVNRHYAATFGAAAAVGVLAGLGQLATGGYRRDGGTVVVAGTTDAVTQAAMQTMNHFLNRLPTITIREGHRMRVYLTRDIRVPHEP